MAVPTKKRARSTKEQPDKLSIEEQLGPLRMAHRAVQWALAEGLRIEPISPEKVNKELHKIIQQSDQPEIVVSRYRLSYDEARTDAERRGVLIEFNQKHHKTAIESKWFQERCAELRMTASLQPVSNPQRHSKWESYPDAKRRRTIVQTNPNLALDDLCKAFDEARISLPPGWDDKYNATTWVEACKDEKARRAISRIISTDRKQN